MDSISNEVNDIPRTSGSDDEARAIDDYIELELEKIRNMTQEEIDAATVEAYEEFYMAKKGAEEATRKLNMASEHLRAIMTSKKDSFMGLKWVRSNQTLREAIEAAEAAIKESKAASQELRAAMHKVDRFTRLLHAFFRARDKRPMTDCESGASCSY